MLSSGLMVVFLAVYIFIGTLLMIAGFLSAEPKTKEQENRAFLFIILLPFIWFPILLLTCLRETFNKWHCKSEVE